MVIRSTISLQPNVFQKANIIANKYHGGNLSGYITYLICRDDTDKIDMAQEEAK